MKKSNDEFLKPINDKSIFYKIKCFFINLFQSKEIKKSEKIEELPKSVVRSEEKENLFIERLKQIETEETKLFKLQKKFCNGEIKEESLTRRRKKST